MRLVARAPRCNIADDVLGPVVPDSLRDCSQRLFPLMAKKQRIRRSDRPVSPLAPFARFLAYMAPVADVRLPSQSIGPHRTLSAEESKKVIEAARILKNLGLEPADIFSAEAGAEIWCRILRDTEGLDDEELLRRAVPSQVKGVTIDALDAPSIRAHLKNLRSSQTKGKLGAEAAALIRCSEALRFSRRRGAPIRSAAEIAHDLTDWLTYLTLRKEFAARTGTSFEKLEPRTRRLRMPSAEEYRIGADDWEALLPSAMTFPGVMEGALKRQVDAFKGGGVRGQLMPAQRVALAFVEVTRRKRTSDDDLDEALKVIRALERNVRLAVDRARIKAAPVGKPGGSGSTAKKR